MRRSRTCSRRSTTTARVIVEGLLSPDVVARVNAEVEAEVAAADPSADMFNPVMQAFHGAQTKQVAGMPGISRTFATDVMCHPRAPGARRRDPRPALRPLPAQPRPPAPARPGVRGAVAPPRRGGVERRPPSGSGAAARVGDRVRRLHRARTGPRASCRAATAGPTASSARRSRSSRPAHGGPDRLRGDAGRARRSSTRAGSSTAAAPTPPTCPGGGPTSATASAGSAPRRTTTCRARPRSRPPCRARRRRCSATPSTTASPAAAPTSAWCGCRTPSSSSSAGSPSAPT